MKKSPIKPVAEPKLKPNDKKAKSEDASEKKRFNQLLDDAIFGVPKTKTGK